MDILIPIYERTLLIQNYNQSTMKFALIFLLCFSLCISNHVLHKFDSEVQKLVKSFNQGDTSHAFSIAMKLYLAVEIMKGELEIQSPNYISRQTPISCENELKKVHGYFSQQNWIENFEEIMEKLKYLQSSCTNRDFVALPQKTDGENNLKGFDDKCALCVVILQVMENYYKYHAKDITDFVERQFCDLFDGVIRPTCEAFVHFAGPTIIRSVLNKQSADVICLRIGFCTNPNCRIEQSLIQQFNIQVQPDLKPAPWQWLKHIFVDKFGNSHLPPFDTDNDTFSDVSTFRGHNWRGADCDELSKNIYPGRKKGSNVVDHDCNGIYGMKSLRQSYENAFCSNSKRFGVAVIGDSAGAHFSIPEKYFNYSMIVKGTYNDLLARVADQLDLPHYSAYTGHVNAPSQKAHSIYKYLREWNLCNHNDYQNLGVNGGDSGNSWGNIKALNRDPNSDYPLLMFLQLIGNDVCAKSFNSMTTTDHFKTNILRLLNWLDTKVPQGSHLMVFGLADGQILYDNLHDSIHPLNVTYTQVYDFLNCLKISPCWGWLNSNETVRNFTTERAQNLSKIYQEIINDGTKFKNFDMVYYDFPAVQILERKIIEGGDPKSLIERCDGFHPNGEFNSYLSDWIWNKIQTQHLDWIGPKNPHNDQIRKIFGHQIIL